MPERACPERACPERHRSGHSARIASARPAGVRSWLGPFLDPLTEPIQRWADSNAMPVNRSDFETVASVMQRRRTLKSLADDQPTWELTADQAAELDGDLRQVIQAAGWAPFHFPRQLDGIAEPWRIHWVDQASCRQVADHFYDWFAAKPGNKMPLLLRGCASLLIVNWVPQTADEIADETKRQDINWEHHAAASAVVQNLLLGLTALGYETFWSSGGPLGSAAGFERLTIPPAEKLLAAVFIEPRQQWGQNPQRVESGQRKARSPMDSWTRQVRL